MAFYSDFANDDPASRRTCWTPEEVCDVYIVVERSSAERCLALGRTRPPGSIPGRSWAIFFSRQIPFTRALHGDSLALRGQYTAEGVHWSGAKDRRGAVEEPKWRLPRLGFPLSGHFSRAVPARVQPRAWL